MGKGGRNVTEVPAREERTDFTWAEVKEHVSREDKWLVVNGAVYDITQWSKRHPGGSRLISHYAGQDASEAVTAFHNDTKLVKKYMQAIYLGRLRNDENKKDEDIRRDFLELREKAIQLGLFKPSICFFILILSHLMFFEIAAYLVMSYYGPGWLPWIVSVLCNTIVQAEAGWAQHDYGHLSVFQNTKLNHLLHQYTMCFTKGASCDWWNHLHFQHHAKPNVLDKDPDVRLDALFVLGETMPKKVAKERKSSLPYNWQHGYFFAIGPPLLFPLYFQYMIFKHSISRKRWVDVFVMCLFYAKILYLYVPLLGWWGTLMYYFAIRVLESHWFVWVSQSNHIPMEIDVDKERQWVPLQLYATCNIEKSLFNDWFTGHLNFQIEHHLFPTMPRHNLYKIAPHARALCDKYNVPYRVKKISTAFADVVRSLKHSGEIWLAYYQMYHDEDHTN